jgi:hypothetical protein
VQKKSVVGPNESYVKCKYPKELTNLRERPDSYKNIKQGICIIAPGMSKAVHSSKPEKIISGHLEMPNTSFCFPSA